MCERSALSHVGCDGKYHEIGTLGLAKSMPRHPQAPKIDVLGIRRLEKARAGGQKCTLSGPWASFRGHGCRFCSPFEIPGPSVEAPFDVQVVPWMFIFRVFLSKYVLIKFLMEF